MQKPYEEENYPDSPEITYYGIDRKINYVILQEGTYPPAAELSLTKAPNCFPLPDNYVVKTTWGRGKNCYTVQCSVDYVETIPHYKIRFGNNFDSEVISTQSPTDAVANLFIVGF
jgi:hypothetical protein